MNIIPTDFEGLFIIETINFQDNRGSFQKLFNYDLFVENGLRTDFKEFYYSISKKNVIRGMHFQLPPFEHTKLVYVSRGKIRDVVIDIRKQDDSIVNYSQTSCYSKGHDCGIAHDSIGFDWGIENPIISSRDLTFGTLKQLKTPF